NQLDLRQSCPMGRFEFPRKNPTIIAGRHKEVSIQAFKLTINLFAANYLFDPVDCSCMTLSCQASSPFTVEALKVEIPIVECIYQVSGCAACFSAPDVSVIQKNHPSARTSKQIGSR